MGGLVNEVVAYEVGEPCWAGLYSPNNEVSTAFYEGLFNWNSYTISYERLGDCTTFTMGPDPVETAGMTKLQDDTEAPGWTCFFSVTDTDAAVGTVEGAGGRAYSDPYDNAHLGRAALCADPLGAGFGLWQAYIWRGALKSGEHGTLAWIELLCPDVEAAKRFYADVFGWTFTTEDHGSGAYTLCRLGDRYVAGMSQADRLQYGDAPAWAPYFAVTDCDTSADRAVELGGTVEAPPMEGPVGRVVVIADPTGAQAGLIQGG
ncbi:VOC family protein [Actinomadura verrucosospora]